MWLFKKKRVEEPKEKECQHKFKDFDWYCEAIYDGTAEHFEAYIYEPYVCIFCGERKDIELVKAYSSNVHSLEEAKNLKKSFEEPYRDRLRDRAFIEDEIQDMILVDRQYIDIYEKLHGNQSKDIKLTLKEEGKE